MLDVMADSMMVWTRQHPEVLRQLEQTGVYRVQESYIRAKNGDMAKFYLSLYRWYTQKGGQLVPVPEGVQFPVWVSLSQEAMLQPVEGTVVLALEIPKELVLVTDIERWSHRVNYWYIPKDPADAREHDEALRQNGIASETSLIQTDKGNFYPLLKQKIIKSWDRLFTCPPSSLSQAQATVWELRRQWLKEVLPYGG